MSQVTDPVPEPRRASDAALVWPWLVRTRRGWMVLQILLMALAEWSTELHLHPPALFATLAALAVLDLAETFVLRRRRVDEGSVSRHAAVDLAALTAVLALSGGPNQPLVSAYLVYVALLAVALPTRKAWAATVAVVGLEWLVALAPAPFDPLTPSHLVGHMAATALAATAITWVVGRVARDLRLREVAEARARQELAVTERLAALGTLAAGLSHELGTPLGTIQLLAESRLAEDEGDEALLGLLAQVDRCRAILDRLREEPAHGDCRPDLRSWVDDWGRSSPEVTVELSAGVDAVVSGSEHGWRQALWVMLDNARRAGARRVRVAVGEDGERVVVRVIDDGRGLSPADAGRVGEPFRSGWGGTGLGLFAARSFATSVGGDARVVPGDAGGAVGELVMRRSG